MTLYKHNISFSTLINKTNALALLKIQDIVSVFGEIKISGVKQFITDDVFDFFDYVEYFSIGI